MESLIGRFDSGDFGALPRKSDVVYGAAATVAQATTRRGWSNYLTQEKVAKTSPVTAVSPDTALRPYFAHEAWAAAAASVAVIASGL
jgi:hypothetical protein